MDSASRAAHAAFPQWSALSYAQRGEYLSKLAEDLVDDEEELQSRIRLFTREHGKILKEATIEMTRLGDRFKLCAAYAPRLAQDEELSGPPFDTIITRQPRGVAALVVPWNWPLSILGAKLPPGPDCRQHGSHQAFCRGDPGSGPDDPNNGSGTSPLGSSI